MNSKLTRIIKDLSNLLSELQEEMAQEEKQKKTEEPGEIYSAEEVVRYFEISFPTLKKYREQGLITAVFPGHRKFYRKTDVIKLMKKLKPNKYSSWSEE